MDFCSTECTLQYSCIFDWYSVHISLFKHIFPVIFVKTFSIVTMHDPTEFQKQVFSEILCSVMYNNNGGSPNKYNCQILSVFYAYKCNFTKFLFYR